MNKFDVSVIIPSIRVNNIEKVLFSLEKSIEPFSFELIIVSPSEQPESLKNKDNIKWFKDFGSPSRCTQIGSTLAEGTYLMWFSDDGLAVPSALAQCIYMFENNKITNKDVVTLRYFEGEGNGEFDESYWKAHTHPDQRLFSVKEHFMCAPLALYNTAYFRELGGLDCRYEHINLCLHDLAYRLQNAGGKVHLSPQTVARFYWSWPGSDSKPVQEAYLLNDRDFFAKEWNQDQSQRIKIDYFNWQNADSVWKRRFK